MMGKRYRKGTRKINALAAQSYLKVILETPNLDNQIRRSASKQLWKVSTRHRIGLPEGMKERYCRKCKILLFPGINSRIRIKKKIRIMTCNICGNIKRKSLGEINE